MKGRSHFSFALVGCGNIGKRHAALIEKYGKLRAVCDIDSARANEFSRIYKVDAFDNLDTLLEHAEGIDIIVICTPNYLHAEQSIAALKKGFHVLCEKPMALNVDDCIRMEDATKEYNRNLLVVKQNRFNPPVAFVKNLVDNKKLGSIYSISMNCLWNRNSDYYLNSHWKGKQQLDGGILFTQFSHFFDIACLLFGKAKCLASFGNNFAHENVTEFDDTIVALMEFENKTLASMHFSTNAYQKNMEGSLTIIGEYGSVSIGGEYLNELTYCRIKEVDSPKLMPNANFNDYGYYTGSMNNHSLVYEYFISSLSGGLEFKADMETSKATIAAIHSVYDTLNKSV